MSLGGFSMRSEYYELGREKLHKNETENEDSKAILDGVVVASLVGLLHQLGDLSLFAAEIFHGLQEEVASTASRNRKLITRVHLLEASFPSLGKTILSQTSHVHFAYTHGLDWHTRIKTEQNHFIRKDLSHFIMDSYEECYEPPRLQLLDRFDTSGPGSCLKRYTDPTLFRQTSGFSDACIVEESQREIKARKIKRKRSWQRGRKLLNSVSDIQNSRRVPIFFTSGRERSSLSQTVSTFASIFRSDLGHKSNSINSKENVAETSRKNDLNGQYYQTAVIGEDIQAGLSTETTVPPSSDVTWDDMLDIMARDIKPIKKANDSSEYDKEYADAFVNKKFKEPTLLHYLAAVKERSLDLNGKLESCVNAQPLSPQVEHMKISFRPIDGFETSGHNETPVTTFSSFQLVPEATRVEHDIVSDSDDDTVSQHSDSYSDSSHLETGESSDDSNDGLCRISSTESFPSPSPEMKACLNEEADFYGLWEFTAQPRVQLMGDGPKHRSKTPKQSFGSCLISDNERGFLHQIRTTKVSRKFYV